MKIKISSILLLATSLFAQAQVVQQDKVPLRIPTNLYSELIQNQLRKIVRTDSIQIPNDCYLVFQSFDSRDTMIQEIKYYQCQSNTKNGYCTRYIYNDNGQKILYEYSNMERLFIERFTYEYNSKGLLVKEEGFGSGDVGITIKYSYYKNNKLKKKKAYRSGKEVKNYFENVEL